ncbi:maker137 [Drosophila busckii]|uniref:Maker137 n=1 Tax=Drosophila busckii TaxID=30019 RepID=A0A0M4EWR2_DROBS|nr:histidine-rich glycoprotein [Drosophila busckii]ALC42587.1 maker137 [Drosophila busckii]
MYAAKVFIFVALFALAYCAPSPGFFKHEHHTIHVPYKVHTVHHHHVQKIAVPVPVVKHVPVYKEVHVPVHHVHHEEIVPIVHDHHDFHHDYHSHGHSHGWL